MIAWALINKHDVTNMEIDLASLFPCAHTQSLLPFVTVVEREDNV